MKATDLRKSILQVAVQGKLVPQDKNDEPASELLKRIQAEKATLIKEGKLKKEKPLPPITEDEIPYSLPDGWVWCRLGAICEFKNGLSKRHSVEGSEQYVLRLADIKDYAFDISNGRKIKCTDDDIEEYSLTQNDMGIIRVNGSRSNVGKAILFEGINCICLFCDHLMRMRLFEPSCKNYMRYALNSKLVQDMMDGLIITTAGQNTISQKSLCGILFPLPPLDEQQRIVAKVDELMALCDELEAAENELDALESHFFDYLPKSILQAAVQGKLVPQDKNDEPASELLKRIQAEKAVLIKEGKLKKEKSLPPITEDEIPYDLPEGWVWCRLGEIAELKIGKTPARAEEKYWLNGKYPWVSIADIKSGQHLSFTKECVSQDSFDEVFKGKMVPKGSLLFSFKLSIGKVCIVDMDTFTNEAICAIIPYCEARIVDFLFRVIPGLELLVNANDAIKGQTLNSKSIAQILIPLPPFAEQQRIVAKVDALMAMCDELKRVAEQPISHDNVMPFPAEPKENIDPIAMAARGEVEGMSDQAKQAIEDLFGEDE